MSDPTLSLSPAELAVWSTIASLDAKSKAELLARIDQDRA